jgi:hypothetical protein
MSGAFQGFVGRVPYTCPVNEPEHGTPRGYSRGCRCQPCKTAHNERCKANQARRLSRLTDDDHGTTRAYRDGCRCTKCKDANTAAHRGYVERKRAEINAQRRALRLADPERFRAVEKAWRDANIERARAKNRRNFYRHREARNADSRRRHSERTLLWGEGKKLLLAALGGTCVDCGISDPRVLHFDHVDIAAKRGGIMTLLRRHGIDSPILWDEMEICVLRCANCHSIKTFENGDYVSGQARRHRSRPADSVEDALDVMAVNG